MAKRKHNIAKPEDYQRYLEDKMSPRERHDFERLLLDHEFEEEAFEGLSEYSPKEVAEDLSNLQASLASRTKKSSVPIIWRAAAALVLLSLFSFVVYYLIDQNTMDKEHSLSKADRVESSESEPSLSSEAFEEQDSTEILAYKQELEEVELAPAEEQELSNSAPKSSKAEIDEKVSVEETEQILEENEAVLELEEEQDIEIPPAKTLDLDLASVEEQEKLENDPIADEIAAPAAARVQSVEAPKANSSAEKRAMRTIRGKVRAEEDDEGVPGVNVILKGSNIGTNTDIDGNYTIDIPPEEEGILVFSFIGLATKEISVSDQEYVDVVMESDLGALAEVVVVAPERRKSRNRKGAVSTTEEREIGELFDNPPQPVGGDKAFREYVNQNINYPISAEDKKVKGTVVLKFKVGIEGEISEMEVEKSLGRDFDQEAIRLVNDGPKWVPARKNDSTVVAEAKVRIRFRPPQ